MWWLRMRRILASFGRDALVLLAACRDPATPPWVRLATIGLLVYAISPIDLVPDALIPLGWLDDVTLLAIGVRFLLRRVPPAARGAAAGRVGGWLARFVSAASAARHSR